MTRLWPNVLRSAIAAAAISLFSACAHGPKIPLICPFDLRTASGESHGLRQEFCARETVSGPQAEGAFRDYYPEGSLHGRGLMHNGAKQGEWHFFHKNGQLLARIAFENGLRDGASTLFSETGILEARSSWKAGLLDGEQKFFDRDGRLKDIQVFRAGKPDGRWRSYDSDGRLIYDGAYVKDRPLPSLLESHDK